MAGSPEQGRAKCCGSSELVTDSPGPRLRRGGGRRRHASGSRRSKPLAPFARGSRCRSSRRPLVRPDFARLGATLEPLRSLRGGFGLSGIAGLQVGAASTPAATPRRGCARQSPGHDTDRRCERRRGVAARPTWERRERRQSENARVRSAAALASFLGVRSRAGPRNDAMGVSSSRARMERAFSSGVSPGGLCRDIAAAREAAVQAGAARRGGDLVSSRT